MKIETIRIKNYRVFRDLKLTQLPELAVFVGANGTGKSTLFDVFEFLRDAVAGNVREALNKRGGYTEVISRNAAGPIEIELQFRIRLIDKERLVTYLIVIDQEQGQPIIRRELLRYKRGRYGSPYRFLDFTNGEGYAIVNEEKYGKDEELEREYQTLKDKTTPAIKGLGQFERFRAANAFLSFIDNWHVSDFRIAAARQVQEAAYAEHLDTSGTNLALVAKFLHEEHPVLFRQVLEKMKVRVPGVTEVEAQTTVDGRIVLRFQDGAFQDPFVARYVSDGTIKMFAYLLLLHDPKPHPLLCIEEPENQLYPTLLPELLEEFRLYARRGGQVFVTTHSPDLLNAARPEEVYWLAKSRGYSTVRRASDDAQISALYAEGDQLGYLWNQRYFTTSEPN